MRKKVDDRIRTLIENGVKTRNRSMFVIIGDKSRDQVSLTPHSISVDDDLEDGAKQIMEKMKTENVGQLNPELLLQYSSADREAGFEQALRSCSTISSSGLISVKSNRDKAVKNNKTADSKKRKRKGYMQTSSKQVVSVDV